MDLPPAPGTMISMPYKHNEPRRHKILRKPGIGWRTGGSTRLLCATAAA